MKNFKTINQVIDFALKNETTACKFYRKLAGRQKNPRIKQLFYLLSKQEALHKKKIRGYKKKKYFFFEGNNPAAVSRDKYATYVKVSDTLDYRDALLLAMQLEKDAYRLYSSLAAATDQDVIKALFEMLAGEEAEHKLRLELEYEKNVTINQPVETPS